MITSIFLTSVFCIIASWLGTVIAYEFSGNYVYVSVWEKIAILCLGLSVSTSLVSGILMSWGW